MTDKEIFMRREIKGIHDELEMIRKILAQILEKRPI